MEQLTAKWQSAAACIAPENTVGQRKSRKKIKEKPVLRSFWRALLFSSRAPHRFPSDTSLLFLVPNIYAGPKCRDTLLAIICLGFFPVKLNYFFSPALQVDGILKTVLRDEIIAWHKKTQEDTSSPLSAAGQPENMDSQQLVSLVQKAVTAIMTRLHNLAQFEGGESKVNTLVAAANSLDNLCRMDPAWHPWL